MNPLTKEDRINTVFGGGGHVVILGAGASIATTILRPESNGKVLPSMLNLIEIVGLQDLVNSIPSYLHSRNFEVLFSRISRIKKYQKIASEIESRVYDYFNNMKLPDEPTIYDYSVLSLRPRDLIASFNWDPFLMQAHARNRHVGDLPPLAFLHGNVAVGYSNVDKGFGFPGMTHRKTLQYYKPTKLIFPILEKDYSNDEFISFQWNALEQWLRSDKTKIVTVFGYSAPKSDAKAIEVMSSAWGTPDDRAMEQFEIIDIKPKEVVRNQWDRFIHSHPYWTTDDFFQSSLIKNPRRTSEWYFQHIQCLTPEEAFSESNPVPSDFTTLQQLWDWFKPLIEAESKWKKGTRIERKLNKRKSA